MNESEIHSDKLIFRETMPPDIRQFLSRAMEFYCKELNAVANTMYNYPEYMKGQDGNKGINDIFSQVEQTLVGLLNNAVIRAFPEDCTLQEFAVYARGNTSVGRADLLVLHACNNNTHINLLIEAKAGNISLAPYTEAELRKYYVNIENQVRRYYKAEKDYYQHPTYLVTITFDRIAQSYKLKECLSEDCNDNLTDFYYIFHTHQAGLAVYGTVIGPVNSAQDCNC